MNYLKDNIKALRKHKGVTQTETATVLKWGTSKLANYETGYSTPGILELIELSKYFDISIDDLIKKDLTKKGAVEAYLKGDKPGVEILKGGSTPSSIKNKSTLYKSDKQPANVAEHHEPYTTEANAPGFDAAYMELMTRIAAMERKLDILTGNAQ
jgi:transcriptional regulator with XRE-family HTH domain